MVLLILLWTLYFIIHSLLASEFVKKGFAQRIGAFFRFYRLGYNFLSIIGFAGIWYFQSKMTPYLLFSPIELVFGVGISLIIIGISLGGIAFFQYRWKEFVGLDQINSSKSKLNSGLVISGFNKHVRHPLYFAGILILAGYFLISPTTQSLIFVSISLIYTVVGTLLEEKKLTHQFGDEYMAYQKRVKMLIPYVI